MHENLWLGLSVLCWHLASTAQITSHPSWPDVPSFAKQVIASGNNHGLPFFVIEKTQSTVWVFSGPGALLGTSVALLGLTIGDESVPGIGDRKLSSIHTDERITPAGRFASTLGHNLLGQEVLWLDYDNAVSLHRVIQGQTAEHRAERMVTPTPKDNRVTYGCINVPVSFFNTLVLPMVRQRGTIVYVLPEQRPLRQVFDFLPPTYVR